MWGSPGIYLGPLLFILYINDLPNAATSLFSILYADDTDMFTSSKYVYIVYVHIVYVHIVYVHVWSTAHAIHLDKLTNLQKRAIRIIAGVPPRSPDTDLLFQKCKLIKFEDVIILNISLFVYTFHCHLLPTTFDTFYSCNSKFHSYETRYNSMLSMPLCRTERTKRTIRYQGVHVWNTILSLSIDVSLEIATFKFHIKKELLQGNFP